MNVWKNLKGLQRLKEDQEKLLLRSEQLRDKTVSLIYIIWKLCT